MSARLADALVALEELGQAITTAGRRHRVRGAAERSR